MMLQAFLTLLLQFAFFSLSSAAPVTTQDNAIGYGTGGGVIGFIVLVLDIIAFMEVLKSSRPVPNKVLWCLLIFLFPVVGVIIYYFFSSRAEHNSSGGYEAISG